MTEKKDMYRAAKILIDKHGKNAEDHARSKLDYFMMHEDVIASSMWLMIAQAIEELRSTLPSPHITIH